jgi:hypothetical protein
MKSKFHGAFVFFFVGLLLVFVLAANLGQASRGGVSTPGRFLFMAAVLIGGMLLCWKGCVRLSDLKKEAPDQTWWQFLKTDLIAIALLASLVGGYLILPKETRDNITKGLRDLVGATRGIRGGRP